MHALMDKGWVIYVRGRCDCYDIFAAPMNQKYANVTKQAEMAAKKGETPN
jgi:hypothetical protein